MCLLMIHEAYMPVYKGSRFSLRADRQTGKPDVVQVVLKWIYFMKKGGGAPFHETFSIFKSMASLSICSAIIKGLNQVEMALFP